MPNPLLRFARFSKALLFTVVVHGALLALLLYSFTWVDTVERGGAAVIQAVAVSERDLRAQIEKDRAAEQQRKQAEQQAAAALQEKKRLAEQKREREQAAAAEKKRQEESRKKAAAEKQRQAEAERKKKLEAEKNRQAEAERKRAAEEAEQKRQAEAERQAAEKRQAEESRRAEEKRQAEAKRRAEEALKKQLAAEEARKAEEKRREEVEAKRRAEKQLAQTRAAAANALGALKDRIAAAVESVWRRPAGSSSGLTALIRVRVARDGAVTFARVAESSGDRLFDESAVIAVQRAAPLPFPAEPKYYEFIKEFNFKFAPDDG